MLYIYKVVYYHLGHYPNEASVLSSVAHDECDEMTLAMDVTNELWRLGIWSDDLVIMSVTPDEGRRE